MPIRLSRFEMPKRVVKEENTATPTFARFVTDPFEVGYARTIGNSLRRVLLSSIEGVAITSVRIKGANHEFCEIIPAWPIDKERNQNRLRPSVCTMRQSPIWGGFQLQRRGRRDS